ncbi:YbhB/YbcL family Raf kinase inhibitor-like protein [Fulvimonas yonginensis]|uniref:YbhB/YbcL family Raf kinase inhibitor-like protein n=1 Tax=Fulvimonas yonginensis TaxID=1495200 RepID=A0ABU8JAK7_9GAMM
MKQQPSPHARRADSALAPVAFQREEAGGEIEVSSPQICAGTAIPARHTAYGGGISPRLRWNPVDGARSYALLVEDPDAPQPRPFVHWLAWNIPPGVHELPEGVAQTARPEAVQGMCQGLNGRGQAGYFGPRPPRGDDPHRYHFQVFALDRTLALPDDAERTDLLTAMHGHVLAKGRLVATSQAPATP